jgi:cobyrinic acid a,c-diamide synthase
VVEGIVTQFEPWSDISKKDETFVVNGHRFHYSDFTITASTTRRSMAAPFTRGCRFASITAGTKSQGLRSLTHKSSLSL